ncbi:aldehyde dehydrogenase family protein [Croceibacterium sp. LX-88]|jgi:aldehyde dehydrogenase (NAD+)|uniref:Aldehyde dehydrogenase family protein n=1 Tax=Croceibacterium selenioxidans TaxID=2838833 RepID=A0ABS5W5B2_9SPHN|nr:aldehyde dehydrogenase family protein [Croceibacterium selenioxidans]MBT2134943.1 aldehyde dehydrogenase family protein [Croceibacterium selenioxidans]
MSTLSLGHFIGGEWTGADDALESLNPSNTGDVVARFPNGGAADVDRAVAAASAAFPGWASASPEVRADLLDKIAATIFARANELGELLAREEGKTRAEGIGETLRAARIFRYFAGEALRRHGQTLESTRPGLDVATYREALGVVGLITPWNFPIAIPAWKAAPALAFGNTVVLKPANITPAVASALTEIIHECGAPAGVFNLVLGRGDVGRAITDHKDIAAVSFTGSQFVGAQVGAAAMARQARVQMEMGGKNPLVVLADADLDKAVAIAADGGFFQTGQRCTASSRVIVEDAIHDRFVAALAERAKAIKVGPALAEGTQVGPASSEAQFEQNLNYIGIATGEGGRLAAGGDKVAAETPGYFLQPTLIADTAPEMRINNEEVFGPVVSTVRVKNYEEALEVANRGDFGLSAGIVSNNAKHIRDFRKNIRAGMVMVNLPTAGVDYHVPFGGTRGSSYGPREQGFAAVEFYTQVKTVYTGD